MNFRVDGHSDDTLVVFAHGAGAGMDSDFMSQFAKQLALHSIRVLRFNFGYMQANAEDGKRRPPERMPKLLDHFEDVLQHAIHEYKPKRLFLMGKSMGGRVATILCANTKHTVNGVMCLGYPFIPIKGGNPRLEPLELCPVPVCLIQGERDRFGNREQVGQWQLPDTIKMCWISDGDHSLQPRKMSGHTLEKNLQNAVSECIKFIGGIHA
ncbi:alpha/beta fold hydrolase [Parashewanella spongiae]|uniref:Alpha/beta fold hydrolase n=1 Tax=Parashewanella spongiae TaxID=342950 RepID=A0A3A6TGD1_9GAMM|nr:alpha/beta fold hydrolase [Parashewanella spongiae]MCL1078790.1 alpha/beta fold hydrolase [Parashewanella spongiae]RJY12208.1 alpha/beta fold hydrolase [Parashewanella spongiae]